MAEQTHGALAPAARLRIVVDELPARETRRSEQTTAPALERLGSAEGAPCHLDCDCRIGLVCVDEVCAEKE